MNLKNPPGKKPACGKKDDPCVETVAFWPRSTVYGQRRRGDGHTPSIYSEGKKRGKSKNPKSQEIWPGWGPGGGGLETQSIINCLNLFHSEPKGFGLQREGNERPANRRAGRAQPSVNGNSDRHQGKWEVPGGRATAVGG